MHVVVGVVYEYETRLKMKRKKRWNYLHKFLFSENSVVNIILKTHNMYDHLYIYYAIALLRYTTNISSPAYKTHIYEQNALIDA